MRWGDICRPTVVGSDGGDALGTVVVGVCGCRSSSTLFVARAGCFATVLSSDLAVPQAESETAKECGAGASLAWFGDVVRPGCP